MSADRIESESMMGRRVVDRPRQRLLILLLLALLAAAAPSAAQASAFKVAVIRATFSDDASRGLSHLFSLGDVQAAGRELEGYYHDLSYGNLSLTVTAANAPDLGTRASYADDTALFDAALSSARRAGYTSAVTGIDAAILLTAGNVPGYCGAYYGQLPLTSRVGGIGDIKIQEGGCASTTAIGHGSHPARVDWGGWAHEIGHALQAAGGEYVTHPAGYADGYNLMDSCYPCGAGVFDLTGPPIVGPHLASFPGWLPASKVTVLPGEGTGRRSTTVVLSPLGVSPRSTIFQQGVKVTLDPLTVPVGGDLTWQTARYYLIEARAPVGADSYGAPGQPRLVDTGVEIHEVDESRNPPVRVIHPCDDAPSGMRCEGDPGAQYPNSYCNSHPAPVAGTCWPFDLWHPGETLHGLDGMDISVGTQVHTGNFTVTITRGSRPHGPDPFIIPWQTPPMNTYETVDLWIDSSCNGYGHLRYGRRSGPTPAAQTVISNGDDPCADHENRLYARVHNGGDQVARNVRVHFQAAYHNFSDPAQPQLADLGTTTIPSIPSGGFVDTYVTWTPSGDPSNFQQPDSIQATLEPQGTNVSTNTMARENVLHFQVDRRGFPITDYPRLPIPPIRPGDPAQWIFLQSDRAARGTSISLSRPLSFMLQPGKSGATIPVNIHVPKNSQLGSTFVFGVQERQLTTEENPLVGPTWPTPRVHPGLDTVGGITLIAQVVAPSSLSIARHQKSSSLLGVSGRLTPAEGTTIAIDYILGASQSNAGAELITHLVKTDRHGRYDDGLHHGDASAIKVRAIWMGDRTHASAVTGIAAHELPPFRLPHLVPIPPFGPLSGPGSELPESLTVSCPSKTTQNQGYEVTGVLEPGPAGRQVALTYTGPKSTLVHVVTAGANGAFKDFLSPPESGDWRMTARWSGDASYQPSESSPCSTFVES